MPLGPPESSLRRRVLLVDDDDLMLTFYKSFFARFEAEFSPVFASNGLTALRHLAARGFDAAILDWDMPRPNGPEILKIIRANPALAAMPVLIISGRNGESDRRTALQAGANLFLSKPFEVAALLAFLRQSPQHQ